MTLDATAEAAPLTLRVMLTQGATFAAEGLPAACSAADSSSVECAFAQPAAGAAAPRFDLPVLLTAPGATATAEIRRGDTIEATLPSRIALELFEAGLDLTDPTWTSGSIAGHKLSVGHLAIGARHAGPRTISGATIDVALTGDAGFVPRLPIVGDLLPAGCTTPDQRSVTLPEGTTLRGGLPTLVTCTLGDLPTGGSQLFERIVAVARPWYDDGDGQTQEPVATVTLKLGDRVVAERQLPLAPTAPLPG